MLFKPKYKYKPIDVSYFDEVLILFAYSCRYDDYYTVHFGKDSVEVELLTNYKDDVRAILEHGRCYGCFLGNQLVGCLLSFSLQDWKHNHIEEYRHFFYGDTTDDNGDADIWVDGLLKYLESRGEAPCYIPIVCTKDEHRCRGIARRLIQNITDDLGLRYIMISDATHNRAMPMWLSNGFREITLPNKVKIVVR